MPAGAHPSQGFVPVPSPLCSQGVTEAHWALAWQGMGGVSLVSGLQGPSEDKVTPQGLLWHRVGSHERGPGAPSLAGGGTAGWWPAWPLPWAWQWGRGRASGQECPSSLELQSGTGVSTASQGRPQQGGLHLRAPCTGSYSTFWAGRALTLQSRAPCAITWGPAARSLGLGDLAEGLAELRPSLGPQQGSSNHPAGTQAQ